MNKGAEISNKSSHDFILKTLREIYGNNIPRFEMNNYTLERIETILISYISRIEIIRIIREDILIREIKYKQERKSIIIILNNIGISIEILSEYGRNLIRNLCLTFNSLNCKNIYPSLFYNNINNNTKEELLLINNLTLLEEKKQQLQKKLEFFTLKLRQLEKDVNHIQLNDTSIHTEYTKQTQLLPYFASKRAEYLTGIAQCNTHLESVGFDSNLTHSAVVEQFEAMKAIPLTSEADVQFLASFADLEPDVDLARKRLQAAKERLANLKRQYSKMLQAINVAE